MNNYTVNVQLLGTMGDNLVIKVDAHDKEHARLKVLEMVHADAYEKNGGLLCVEDECEEYQTGESEYCTQHED